MIFVIYFKGIIFGDGVVVEVKMKGELIFRLGFYREIYCRFKSFEIVFISIWCYIIFVERSINEEIKIVGLSCCKLEI